MVASALARAHSRPWLYLHAHARVPLSHLHGHAHTGTYTRTVMLISLRAHLRRDQRGRLTQTYAFYQLTQIPTSNDWGAWASTPASTSTSGGGGAAACMIGPKGPIMVRPEGRTDDPPEGQPASSGLIVEPEGSTACWCVSTTACLIGSEDPIIVRPGGRTDGGLHRGTAHG